MKRETRRRVQDERLPLQSNERCDILDSDAKQRATIRDLRARLVEVGRLAAKYMCTHEERHRAGVIWEVCDYCGQRWADDRGGFRENPDVARCDEAMDLKNKHWRHVCVTTSGDEQRLCDDPKCPRSKR